MLDSSLKMTWRAVKLSCAFAALTFLALSLATSEKAGARELQGRFGLGYNAEFANTRTAGGPPGLSIKYGLTRDIATEFVFGISTGQPSNRVTAVKFFKNIFYETNLNFYYMLGGGLVKGAGHSGVEMLSGFGAEFFLPGLESLGFAMEVGGSFHNLKGSYALETLGVSFLNAGIHFYF